MIQIHADETDTLILGRVGENDVTQVVWERIIAAWLAEYPNAAIGLINRPSRQSEGYPVANVQQAGGTVTWTIKSSDLAEEGRGQCQLVAVENEAIKKSAFWNTRVLPSLTGSATPPDPMTEWWDALVAMKADAEAAAESASGSATAAAGSATEAASKATSASTSATKAKTSEQNAAVSETQARFYAGTASDAATAAQQSAYSANNAKNTATQKASEASFSAQAASTAASHYPKIVDGYWMVWDVQLGAYVSTGVEARGPYFTPSVSDQGEISWSNNGGLPNPVSKNIKGPSGAVFTPSVSEQGEISWSNDGGLPNPTARNIKGGRGENGTNAYVHIRYAQQQPTQDSDMSTTPGPWMGMYSGSSATAPEHYTDYEWNQVQGPSGEMATVTVTGSTPSITAANNTLYQCGELATLTITPPASGIFGVVFTSGSTATVLTATGITWPSWFDATSLDANTIYEINVWGGLALVTSWEVSA